MSIPEENPYSTDYFEYLHQRSAVRKWIRSYYLRDIRKYCFGPTIDFGCGTGELLRMLPAGSMGFEVNPVATAYCRSEGLNVDLYDPLVDDYRFDMIAHGQFISFTMNHVLEHIEDAHLVADKIYNSCHRIGIRRIVLTIPGVKGYDSDATHRTFIDKNYFDQHGLLDHSLYKFSSSKYFPLNIKAFGKIFTHNELRLIFDIRK